MDAPRPAERIYVTVGGQRLELVPTAKMLGPELKELKNLSGGMPLAVWSQAIKDMDWDAWLAWITVSFRHKIPATSRDDIEGLIGDTPPLSVIESIENEAPESAQPDPQALPSEGGSQKNEDDSGETTPPPSTSDPSGHQTSGTQT